MPTDVALFLGVLVIMSVLSHSYSSMSFKGLARGQ